MSDYSSAGKPLGCGGFSFNSSALCGTGIGLRAPHAEQLATGEPPVKWLEVLADNYFADGGLVHRQLTAIRQHYPIALHSVGMSVGSTAPLNKAYFKQIKHLINCYQPALISDHLCFTGADNIESHDLLPLPFTEEAVRHTAERIMQIQDLLGTRIVIENISSYLRYHHSTMDEAEFITAVAEQADCFILLDINNAYVNQVNHGEDAMAFIERLPIARVKQVHLGGYETKPNFLLDAHNHAVSDPVWELFARFAGNAAEVPVLIEWDRDLPSLDVLLEQAQLAQAIMDPERRSGRAAADMSVNNNL